MYNKEIKFYSQTKQKKKTKKKIKHLQTMGFKGIKIIKKSLISLFHHDKNGIRVIIYQILF